MTKVTFDNIFKTNVLDNIQKLIKQTIPSVPFFYDEHRGNESFLVRPIADSFVDFLSNAHIRSFTVEISYEINSSAEFTKDKDIHRLTNRAEHIKRILFNNKNLTINNETQWYNATVNEIIYERDEENEKERESFILTFE